MAAVGSHDVNRDPSISANGWRATAPGRGCRERSRELPSVPRSETTL
jgi:hypothetical protein